MIVYLLLPLVLNPFLLLTTAQHTPADHQIHSPNDLTYNLPSSSELPNFEIHIKRTDPPPLTIPYAHVAYTQSILAGNERLKKNLAAYRKAVSDFKTIVADPKNSEGYRNLMSNEVRTGPAISLINQLKIPRQVIEHGKAEAYMLTALAVKERRRKDYSSGTSMSKEMQATLDKLDETAASFMQAISSTETRSYNLIRRLERIHTGLAPVVSHLQLM